MATKTLSIRLTEEELKVLDFLAEEKRGNISKTAKELMEKGRVMLAIEKYRKSEVSLEKAARVAGLSISKMMDTLREHGVEANLEYEDYLKSLKSARKLW